MKNIWFSSLLFFALSLAFSCSEKTTNTQVRKKVNQEQNQLSAEWEVIKQLEEAGAGKSLILKLDELLVKAKSEADFPSLFKALALRAKYVQNIEEGSSKKIITQFESACNEAQFPQNAVLHSALGELYFQYYQLNKWRFQNRSEAPPFSNDDLESWSLHDILKQSDLHYKKSVQLYSELQQEPLGNLKRILSFDQNSHAFGSDEMEWLSYADFLSSRFRTYFKQRSSLDENQLVYSNSFRTALISPWDEFRSLEMAVLDTSANAEILSHFQLCLSAQEENNPRAFVRLNLERLTHYYQKSSLFEKDSLYLKSLQNLKSTYPDQIEIHAQLAKLYIQWGNNYSPEIRPENRLYLKKAWTLLEQAKKRNTSIAARNCEALQLQLQHKEFRFQLESIYPSDWELEFQVNSKNIDSLHWAITPIAKEDLKNFYQSKNREEQVQQLLRMKFEKEWSVALENPGDFQAREKLVSFKQLPIGHYLILASTEKDYTSASSGISFKSFQVSNLAYRSRYSYDRKGLELQILDRKTGQAVPAVHIDISLGNRFGNVPSKKIILESDANGRAFLASEVNQQPLQLIISKGADQLDPFFTQLNSSQIRNNPPRNQISLFTDRAIYRPGQEVFFKGIVSSKTNDKATLNTNYSGFLRLLNPSRKEIKQIPIKSNAFGSFSGSFQLPSAALAGSYFLQTEAGGLTVQVENYKRPSFYLELDSLKNAYKLGDTIQMNGEVLSYSGQSMANSQIKIRVVRKAIFPKWAPWGWPIQTQSEREVHQEVVRADSDGKFSFAFFADSYSQKASANPRFQFEMEIEATALNGETQKHISSLLLSNKDLHISSNLSNEVNEDDLKKLQINCRNSAGISISATGQLELIQLTAPTSYKLPRLWETNKPEPYYNPLLNGSQADLSSSLDIRKLKESHVVGKTAFFSHQAIEIFQNLKPGPYLIRVKLDGESNESYDFEQRFVYYNPNSSVLAMPQFHFFKALKAKALPGESASLLLGSSAKNMHLLYEVFNGQQKIESREIVLQNEQVQLKIPIQKVHEGGLTVLISGIHSNRIIQYRQSIEVPIIARELEVKLKTFRDKTQPGATENWQLKIQNQNGTVSPYEVLASMYDKSLDQLRKQHWKWNPYQQKKQAPSWYSANFNRNQWGVFYGPNLNPTWNFSQVEYPRLNWFGFHFTGNRYGRFPIDSYAQPLMQMDAASGNSESLKSTMAANKSSTDSKEVEKSPPLGPMRSDFSETVFFYPQLKSDKAGKLALRFKMPDALTTWKFRAFVHGKQLEQGSAEQELISQKSLMVFPNIPRFFRAGDTLYLQSGLSNLSSEIQRGSIQLRFINPISGLPLDLCLDAQEKAFLMPVGANKSIKWKVVIPAGYRAVQLEVVASTDEHQDGETHLIPILPKKELLTESMAINLLPGQQKSYSFKKLLEAGLDSSLRHVRLQFDYSNNPAWAAILALPALTEKQAEHTEAIFARLFANSIARQIQQENPLVRTRLETWKSLYPEAMKSNLEKNKALKLDKLENGPWELIAADETNQRKQLLYLFDENRIRYDSKVQVDKLLELQLPSGAWPWFKGMRANRFITQTLLASVGHLSMLGMESLPAENIELAVKYLDSEMQNSHQKLIEMGRANSSYHPNNREIQYLYVRSFFPSIALQSGAQKAFNFYLEQARAHWLTSDYSGKAMLAISLNRYKPSDEIAKKILASLSDHSLYTEDQGMYWKKNTGYNLFSNETSRQALMIEAFSEISNDFNLVNKLKHHLISLKQRQAWPSSKSTSEAIYALFTQGGTSLLEAVGESRVQIGDKTFSSRSNEHDVGLGSTQVIWLGEDIKPKMGNVILENNSPNFSFGALHWQYESDLEEIQASNDQGLNLQRRILIRNWTSSGEQAISPKEKAIQIGDELIVKLRIECKQELDFVHLVDQHASGMEPIFSTSGTRHQDGLTYYLSKEDSKTHYYIEHLPKGVYLLEYRLRANVAGDFEQGLAKIQCAYAPEFSSHTASEKMEIIGQ